jgi:ArsR family transcriptional regulator
MLTSSEFLSQQLKALAEPTRMRLLLLCRQGECSVSELAQVVGQSQPRVSQHLKQLCDADLLHRFRDGKRVFYRVPVRGRTADTRQQLLQLIPAQEPVFGKDNERLREIRGDNIGSDRGGVSDELADRAIYRAILDLTVTAAVGDLLDIGCGRGSLLKLLATRANRAVGVDIDADARQVARAELMLAGIPGCSLRQGDMYRLPFEDAEFDTIILDDVLLDADDPLQALREASRLLKESGRLLILLSVAGRAAQDVKKLLAEWNAAAGLRLAPPRMVPLGKPSWMLSVATKSDSGTEAA